MSRLWIAFLVLAIAVNLTAGCHWFRGFGRKKRSTAAEAAESRVWRNYFAQCMFSKVSSYDWTTPVDYTILQTVWHVNIDQWQCSSAGGQDTGTCWKGMIDGFLQQPLSGYAKTCIDEYEFDVSSGLLRYRKRKKRGLAVPEISTPKTDYARCLQKNDGRIRGVAPLDYDVLTDFVRKYTVYGCDACGGECSRNQPPLPPDAPPQWPYRLLALTRTDSPIRNAIAKCNDQFFPGNPFWSNWSPWQPPCATSCNFPGIQSRSRTCRSGVTPTRKVADRKCTGEASERRNFVFPLFPGCQPPFWSNWDNWAPECPPCGKHARTRSRICRCGYNATIAVDCKCCFGDATEQEMCRTVPCLAPTWGSWGPWNPRRCPCGRRNVKRRRRRRCRNSQFPWQCRGKRVETINCPYKACQSCDERPCWTRWTNWSGCNLDGRCQSSRFTMRSRLCRRGSVQLASFVCPGDDIESVRCRCRIIPQK